MRLAALLVSAVLLSATPAAVPAAGPGAGADRPAIDGSWVGAKLRCQKEEGKLVRCGTPTPFEVTFIGDGSGFSPDESLPGVFTWRWLAPKEIGVTPKDGGEEIKLFSVESEEGGALTFQAYIYLPTADPNAPAESRYIHFVFDVNRVD